MQRHVALKGLGDGIHGKVGVDSIEGVARLVIGVTVVVHIQRLVVGAEFVGRAVAVLCPEGKGVTVSFHHAGVDSGMAAADGDILLTQSGNLVTVLVVGDENQLVHHRPVADGARIDVLVKHSSEGDVEFVAVGNQLILAGACGGHQDHHQHGCYI